MYTALEAYLEYVQFWSSIVSQRNYQGPQTLNVPTISPSIAVAGVGVLVAITALVMLGRRRHVRWLTYAQIGLWLIALAAGIVVFAIAYAFYEYAGVPLSLVGWFLWGEIPIVIAIALLIATLRRPASL